MSRTIGALVAGTVLAVLGLLARAEAQPVHVSLIGPRQPVFFTCVVDVPLPPEAPPGARSIVDGKARSCGTATGYTLMVRIDDGAGRVPMGQNVVQAVQVKGSRFKIAPATGKCEREEPFAFLKVEYFENPAGRSAIDPHITVECCELRYKEDIQVATSIMPLPPGARPPVSGFTAGYPYTTADELDAVITALEASTGAIWGHNYVHDTCNRPRRTPTGTVHWMQYNLEYSGISGSTLATGN